MSNYELQIISHHSQSNGKALRQYNVEGISTVGAFGNEEFSIRFKNNTWQKIQVRLSVDGTCIRTGKPADTSTYNDGMWVVQAYGTLELKAWCESDRGGAAFVFTSADNSVAVHTHGDLSSRGIIAAAVFTEGQEPIKWIQPIIITQPITFIPNPIPQPQPYNPWTYPYYPDPYWTTTTNLPYLMSNNSKSFGTNDTYNSCSSNVATTTSGYLNTESLESVAGVGAGNYVEQVITHTVGLIKPILTETIRVKYMWYDDLVAKLRVETAPQAQPSGFPGDKTRGIDLGSTPRIGEPKKARKVSEPVFARV